MAMLQKLCPEMLQESRLYWLRPPIYKEGSGNNAKYYYTEQEFQNRIKGNGEIIKYKGLGQLDDVDVKKSMFGEYQRLEQLEYTEEATEVLELLMGEDTAYRKDFVFNNIDFGEFDL